MRHGHACRRSLSAILGALLLACMAAAHAHKMSDSYLSLSVANDGTQLNGQWEIALRDLDHALGIDSNGDSQITWGELRSQADRISQFAFSHLALSSVQACPARFQELLVNEHTDGAYAVLRFNAPCSESLKQLRVKYSLLFDLDADHRGLLDFRAPATSRTAVLSNREPTATLELGVAAPFEQFRSFAADGFIHILHGYDHILFLLTLLLPAVVLYQNGRWQPRQSLRESVLDVAGVVTAFTVAHSITLALGVTGWIELPSRLVEATIAMTVVLGALNNLFPLVTRKRWLVAFLFGLVHGLGFASVLADFGLERGSLAIALTAFNVGVEIGQLAIVISLVPIAFLLRETRFYRRVVMPASGTAICCVAAYWFVMRALT